MCKSQSEFSRSRDKFSLFPGKRELLSNLLYYAFSLSLTSHPPFLPRMCFIFETQKI